MQARLKLCLAVIIVWPAGHAACQEAPADWVVAVDSSTSWGQWLEGSVRPYWRQIMQATKIYIERPASEMDPSLSAVAVAEKARECVSNYALALSQIVPPDDLQPYHAKMLNVYSSMVQFSPQELLNNEDMLTAMREDADQELTRVFSEHGVPQQVIDQFLKNPSIAS